MAEETNENTVKAKPRKPRIRIGRYWSTVIRFYHATPRPGTSGCWSKPLTADLRCPRDASRRDPSLRTRQEGAAGGQVDGEEEGAGQEGGHGQEGISGQEGGGPGLGLQEGGGHEEGAA